MQRNLYALMLAAFAFGTFGAIAQSALTPLAAAAQPAPPPPPPDDMGPPPEMRAKMEAMHAQAKTDTYAALTPDHRAKTQAIVAQVAAGALEPRAAAQQIDALLTPDEQKSIAGIEEKMRDQMRTAFAAGGGPPGPPGPPPGHMHRPTPGGFVLRVSMTPEQMRALRAPRPSPTP